MIGENDRGKRKGGGGSSCQRRWLKATSTTLRRTRTRVIKVNVVPSKVRPEVVLLLIQASHHVIALAALAAELKHAEPLAHAVLLSDKAG